MPDGALRWPVHPEPTPGEALTSWLGRLAGLYRLSVEQLLTYNLGPASAQFDVVRPRDAALDYQVPAFDVVRPRYADLDYQAPAAVLRALTARTGIAVGRLRRMTISGCVPWLADTLDPADGQKAFSAYVRQDSVLLPPGRAGYHVLNHWVPWLPARSRPWRTARRVCPTCPPDRGILLLAALPLMISCAEHGCRLERVHEVRRAHRYGEPMTPRPVPDAVAALDRLTFEGIATGECHTTLAHGARRGMATPAADAAGRGQHGRLPGRPRLGRHAAPDLGHRGLAGPGWSDPLAAVRAAEPGTSGSDAARGGHRSATGRGREDHSLRHARRGAGTSSAPAHGWLA